MRKSWKKSRKLVLGIAVALGCSMASVAFADSVTVYDAAINGHYHASGTDKYDQY